MRSDEFLFLEALGGAAKASLKTIRHAGGCEGTGTKCLFGRWGQGRGLLKLRMGNLYGT